MKTHSAAHCDAADRKEKPSLCVRCRQRAEARGINLKIHSSTRWETLPEAIYQMSDNNCLVLLKKHNMMVRTPTSDTLLTINE